MPPRRSERWVGRCATVSTLLGVAKAELQPLDDAAAALESGSYCLCQRCGQPIAFARLETLPDTTVCIACASRT